MKPVRSTSPNRKIEEMRLLRAYVRNALYDELIEHSEHTLLAEGLNDTLKGYFRDLLKVALGAGAVVGTGGMGGDTITDMVFAMDSSTKVMAQIDEISSTANELREVIDAAIQINMSNGPDAIYKGVLKITQAIAEHGDEEAFATAKEAIDELIAKLANAIGEWAATALPDDAGLGGIAIREMIEQTVASEAEDVYELLKVGFNKLPKLLQDFINDPDAMEDYFGELADDIVAVLEGEELAGAAEKGGEEEEGLMDKATDVVKTVGKKVVALNPAVAAAKPMIIDYLNGDFRTLLAAASKIPNVLVTVTFGSAAFLQIMLREEYKVSSGDDKKGPESAALFEVKNPMLLELTRDCLQQIIREEIELVVPPTGLELEVGGKHVSAEVSACPRSRNQGLMYRMGLAPDCGMLFVYPDSAPRSFWMENTYIPLSIAFIDEAGVILNVEDMLPFDRNNVWSDGDVVYALEMVQGWFDDNQVGPGRKVSGLPGYSVM